MAEEYLNNNQVNEAEKELSLAKTIQSSDFQAVNNSTFEKIWNQKQEAKPEEIKDLIKHWQQIVLEKPNYRDGYLRLSLLHYKIDESEKANEYLEKAFGLDPNYEPARQMEKILK